MKKILLIALTFLVYAGLATAMWNFGGAAWVFFCGVLFGGLVTYDVIVHFFHLYRKYKYEYKCPIESCGAHFAHADDPVWVAEHVDEHKAYHARGGI